MKNKIDLVELLKDCPKGMELDCSIWDNVVFDHVDTKSDYPIYIKKMSGELECLTEDGCFNFNLGAKCVIFPKGKTTWDGFHRPFKDGDVLSYQYKGYKNRTIYIYMQHSKMNTTYYVALSGDSDSRFMINDKEGHALNSYDDSVRLATEEEKKKLFDAIETHGYHWNDNTKTLEKLVKPKFKVGDKIRHKTNNKDDIYEISAVYDDFYGLVDFAFMLDMKYQDQYEFVPTKFDINTLKPLKSEVLVRNYESDYWKPAIFGFTEKDKNAPFFVVGGNFYYKCIPYEGNEHLLGTTDDCDDYYKL